jgi:plastocyanin
MNIRGLRKQLALGACAALLAIAAVACGDDDDDVTATATVGGNGADNGSGAAQAATVAVADNSFTPARVTIATGGTVTWEWGGEFPHSVVGDFAGTPVESDAMTGVGNTFAFTFDEAGTFNYQCGVHGESMAGTIVIET